MRLAHLSDPHLAPLPSPTLRELASKRILGFANWHRKRRFIHRADILAGLVDDLRAQRPDHIACTGDLVNIATPAEFLAAKNFLAALGAPTDVTLVPGNHDAYVRAAACFAARHWGCYMRDDELRNKAQRDDERDDDPASRFPFVRRRGGVALIGLSSGVPTAPFRATGRLGDAQLARLDAILAALARDGAFRVVMIHHPPQSDPSHRAKWLEDAAALRAVLAQAGAELVLHGHDHVASLVWLDGPAGARIPAVGVPSASAAPGGRHEAAAYNLYAIDGGPGAWRCAVTTRGIAEGAWRETGAQRLF